MITAFQQRVYDACAKIPRGRVSTYKEIACAIGCRSYQAIGQALTKNPFAPKVPCHRVVSSDGSLGGFAWGPQSKIRMLRREGVSVVNGRIRNFENVFFRLTNKKRKTNRS